VSCPKGLDSGIRGKEGGRGGIRKRRRGLGVRLWYLGFKGFDRGGRGGARWAPGGIGQVE